jgi:hypothetical protein
MLGMKPTVTVAFSLACLLTTAAMAPQAMGSSPGNARADSGSPFFQSPSGNVQCNIGSGDGIAFAACEIREHNLATPPLPTLPYGQARSIYPITCDSAAPGVTCRDTDSGHFFVPSRENFEMH